MTEIDDDKQPQNGADTSESGKPRRLRLKLKTQSDIANELARLYRDARADQIVVADASKLANMLHLLSRVLETSELEARIEALEASNHGKH